MLHNLADDSTLTASIELAFMVSIASVTSSLDRTVNTTQRLSVAVQAGRTLQAALGKLDAGDKAKPGCWTASYTLDRDRDCAAPPQPA
jgi:uncharacterized protein YejL (UPF0352 family)